MRVEEAQVLALKPARGLEVGGDVLRGGPDEQRLVPDAAERLPVVAQLPLALEAVEGDDEPVGRAAGVAPVRLDELAQPPRAERLPDQMHDTDVRARKGK